MVRHNGHVHGFKNITILTCSIVLTYFLARIPEVKQILLGLGDYGYYGAFFAGMLFISTFSVSIGALLLFIIGQYLNPFEVTLYASVGGVVGDMLIYKFVKDSLVSELKPIYEDFGGKTITKIIKTKHFQWFPVVIGSLIMISPFPDELGVALLGISNTKSPKFLLLSFIFNFIGIFMVVSASRLF